MVLHVLSGPCGSGKSTRAAEISNASRTSVVCYAFDEVRGDEPPYDTTGLLTVRVAKALLCGKFSYVVVDACNLHEHDYIRWETVAWITGAVFKFERLKTPMTVCIARDLVRSNPVGAAFIREQFNAHL